jgi:hypothetical protein
VIEQHQIVRAPAEDVAQWLEELDHLSDDEIDALLATAGGA